MNFLGKQSSRKLLGFRHTWFSATEDADSIKKGRGCYYTPALVLLGLRLAADFWLTDCPVCSLLSPLRRPD
jgi:hypothetical protein